LSSIDIIEQFEGAERMITRQPEVKDLDERHYVGIRTQVPMQELPKVIPQSLGQLFAWLRKQGVAPSGAPFIRYHVINMKSKLDVELGVPIASTPPGDGVISSGVLPAGRYAALTYAGVENGMKANAALLDWGAAQGLAWDNWQVENGDAFGCRIESFLTDPDVEPDMAKWETEVAIRVADNLAR
jgi:effector-binding domain-containing protein